MTDFESALRERLRGLVSTAEPSNRLRNGMDSELRRTTAGGRVGSGHWAIAAVAASLVVATASVLVIRQQANGDQRVAAGTSRSTGSGAFLSQADGSRHPSVIRVVTANATDSRGLATAALDLLESEGYVGIRAIDALRLSDGSRVHFAPGYEPEARALARLFGLAESAVDGTDAPVPPTGADLVVVIGQNLVGNPLLVVRTTGETVVPPSTGPGSASPPDTSPPLLRPPLQGPPITMGTTRDGRAWSLLLGGPSGDLCFSMELAHGSATRTGACAGNPGGRPTTNPYRPLFHNEARTPSFVFGRMPPDTVAIEVVASVPVGGRVAVTQGPGGPFYVVELLDPAKPEAVIGYRADGTSERYSLPG